MTALKRGFQTITSILSKEQTIILETALLTMVPTILTKITGQFFSLLAASYFGTENPGWNQFLLASSIPDMLTNVLLGGSIGVIIIPTLIAIKRKYGVDEFLKLYSSVINGAILAFGGLSLIVALFADIIFPLMLNTLSKDNVSLTSSEISQMVSMMRVLLIPQIILGVSVLVSSGLNIYNRYLIPQLAPLFFNLGRITGLVILVPLLNFSPWAIVIGVMIGSVLHLLIQLPLAWNLGLKYKFYLKWDTNLKHIFLVSLPRTFALASENIALTFNDFLAFALSSTSLASLNYANSVSLVIPSLFGATFAYASFTTLSELFDEDNREKIQSIIIKTLNEMLFLALPFIITILILRVAIVRLAFGLLPNTRLELDGTHQIAWVLLWFAMGHIFVCGKWFMYKVFYAAKNTIIPFLVSLMSLILTIVLGIIFTNLFSHNADYSILSIQLNFYNLFNRAHDIVSPQPAVGGIALGMSIAYSLEFFVLIAILHFRKIKLDFKGLLTTTGKKFIAGGIMFTVMYLIYKTWNALTYALPIAAGKSFVGSTTLNLAILTIITVGTSFLVYYLVCLLLGVEELKILKKYLNPIFRLGGVRIKD